MAKARKKSAKSKPPEKPSEKSAKSKAKKPAKSTPAPTIEKSPRREHFAPVLPIEEVAGWLGVGAERIRQLIKMGQIPKAARGLVPLKAAVQGYLRSLKDETKSQTKSASAARVQEARTVQINLRTAREIGELVPFEEARAVTESIVGRLMAGLNGLPAQLTRDLDERRRIERAIDGIRSEVAGSIAQFSSAYTEIDEPDSAEAEDTAGRLGETESPLSGDGGPTGPA